MKRKFLEDMGLTKEQVDGIMAENGNDIEAIKQERDTYKGQLDVAQSTLKTFEGVNLTELQGKVQTLTADLERERLNFQKQITDRDFDDLLKTTATNYKPRDMKAVMPFIDVEKLKGSKNQEADIKAAFEGVKKEKAYLFQDTQIPRVVAPTPGPGGENIEDTRTRANDALRSILGRE